MVSITDVANEAGVSPTTVSHAISGKRTVSTAVKARVDAAMELLGYTPSRSAQNLALGVTRIIALIIPDIGNGFFAELAKGVERFAVDHGYNVLLCTTGFDHAREVKYLAMIRSRAVDGVVYAAGAPPTDSELSGLLGNMPLVLVDEEIAGANVSSVVSDNEFGGQLAAEHLLGLGHKSVLVLEASGNLLSSGHRVTGFSGAWSAEEGTSMSLATGAFTEEGGRTAVAPYVEEMRSGGISAVFAVNDLMALGAMNEMRSCGIQVPEMVSVVGFDDIAAVRYSRPALTTIRQNVLDLGATATKVLIETLENKGEPLGRQIVLPVELIIRESSAPYQASLRATERAD